MITEKQQKLYELAKAENLLKKHKILDSSQEAKIKDEKDKELKKQHAKR